VVDELRRRRAEHLEQPAMQLLVGAVVVAAHDVGDPEVDVVHDAGEVVGGRPVLAHERHPVEAHAQLPARFDVPLPPFALAHRPLVPLDSEPLEVAQQLLLTAGHVARGVGVVDPEQQPVAETAVGDRAERVADVQRTGWAGSEADLLHGVASVVSSSIV
jgi:hypothetical protein